MNISSIVIRCQPEHYDEIIEWCNSEKVCEFHFGDKEQGKIIVTIEGADVNEEIGKLMMIQRVPHVITADMMMTYQEDLEKAFKEVEEADPVPELLTKEDVDPDTVVYHGDLKKKL